jgi:hypothetical protein
MLVITYVKIIVEKMILFQQIPQFAKSKGLVTRIISGVKYDETRVK